jgi:hypothetical protein
VAVVPKKRPCRICRRWFEPHPRAGDRQRVCSDPACQHERHRRSDRAWHAENPDYDRKRRLKDKLVVVNAEDTVEDPLAAVDWAAAEAAIGPAHRVVTEHTARLLVEWAQDAVLAKVVGGGGQPDRLPPARAQDAVAAKDSVQGAHPDRLPRDGRKTQSDRGPPHP